MPLRLKALSTARAEFGDTKCVTGFIVAPFSSVCYLYGVTEALLLLLDNPELFLRTIKFFVTYQIADGLAQIEAGAHAVLIADLFAASSFISTSYFERYSLPSLMELIRVFHEQGAVVFYHPNESLVPHLKKMAAISFTNKAVLTIGTDGNVIEAKRALGDSICLMGSFDPVSILRDSPPHTITSKTKELIDKVGRLGGFMIYSGGTVAVDTPQENVRTLVRTARDYWR
jgi:uroporphyrinogen decarboxylase